MAFNPIVIEKGLNAGVARAMADFYAARQLSPGLMAAVLMMTSTGAYEKMGWMGAMAAVQQWIGELAAKGFEDYDYTLKNLDWAATAPINENDLADDQTGSLAMIPVLLAKRILAHPEKLVISLLTGGTSGLAYDGVAFFSDASGARLIDNLMGGTGVTLAQLEADLNSALVQMAKFTDNEGEVLNIKGDTIVCPVALERKFRRLVSSDTDPTGTVEGTYNPYRGMTVIGDARLDAADANDWYLLATREPVKPFVFSMRQEGRPLMEKTPHTKRWIYSVDYRGNAGYGLPHLAVKTVNT
jgi:phage major head subunit gpT-like protein